MRRILTVVLVALVALGASSIAFAQDKATPEEVIAKVRQAAAALSKSGDLEQFKQQQGPWVWKDTYVFVLDCDKKVAAVNAKFPQHQGMPLTAVKDVHGKQLYGDPAAFCEAATKPAGTWIEYSWPKPGQKEGLRKVSYFLGAKGTPYVVGAGVYDDKASIAELTAMSSK